MSSVTKNEHPFSLNEVEDVRIIIRAKGKHWAIVPQDIDRNVATAFRIATLASLLELHAIVDTPLEDIRIENRGKGDGRSEPAFHGVI